MKNVIIGILSSDTVKLEPLAGSPRFKTEKLACDWFNDLIRSQEKLNLIIQSVKNRGDKSADEVMRILGGDKFRFTELDTEAQRKAVRSYQQEFNDGCEDPTDRISIADARSGCEDSNNDLLYNADGEVIG